MKSYIIAGCLLLFILLIWWIHTDNRAKVIRDFLQSKEFMKAAKVVILAVESLYKGLPGNEKMQEALKMIIDYIPEQLRPFITPELLISRIQAVFDLIAKVENGHTVPQDIDI